MTMPIPQMTTREMGLTVAMVLSSVGKYVHLETHDGSYREGKLTGFTHRQLVINGKPVDWPVELELNGDPGDVIKMEQIKGMQID